MTFDKVGALVISFAKGEPGHVGELGTFPGLCNRFIPGGGGNGAGGFRPKYLQRNMGTLWRHGGVMVSALTSGLSAPGLSPG